VIGFDFVGYRQYIVNSFARTMPVPIKVKSGNLQAYRFGIVIN
jgi:hypothetical protein